LEKKASQSFFAAALDCLSHWMRTSRQSASSSSIRVNSGIFLCRAETAQKIFAAAAAILKGGQEKPQQKGEEDTVAEEE